MEATVKYLLLIYDDETVSAGMSEAERGAEFGRWGAVTQAMMDAGVFVGGDALLPTPTATSVRVRNGRTLTTDGPFAETKEQLGGYYIVDVPDLDEALKWAARLPASETGTIEVRPLMVFEG
jgi:hypothetical protein